MSWLARLGFGRGRQLDEARRLEREGKTGEAVDAFAAAGAAPEAVRLLLQQVDGQADVSRRIALLERASSLTPDGPSRRALQVRSVRLSVALLDRHHDDLLQAELASYAARLDALGEPLLAADLWRRAGDARRSVESLIQAGEVERVEADLQESLEALRLERRRAALQSELALLEQTHQRRRILALAKEQPDDPECARLIAQARWIRDPSCTIRLDGEELTVLLRDEVTVGRSETDIVIGAARVSRTHLVIRRAGPDEFIARDVGTQNGTSLSGMAIGELRFRHAVRLMIAGEFPCALEPTTRGLMIHVGGRTYLACFGAPIAPGVTLRWPGDGEEEAFGELLVDPSVAVFGGEIQLGERSELAVGDTFSLERGAPPFLEIVG